MGLEWKVGVGIGGGAVAVMVVGAPKFRVGSEGGGADGGALNPVRPRKWGGSVTGSFLSADASAGAADPAPSRESKDASVVFIVAGGVSPVILIAGASVGAVVGAGIKEVGKSEGGGAGAGIKEVGKSEWGGASVEDEERAAVALVAFDRGGLLKNPVESVGASALGATGGAENEVRVGATFDIEGLIGSVLVTVIAGRVVGATILKAPVLPALVFELTAATFESVTRALSLSNALASASRFSSMLSICRPGMLLAPTGRAQDVRPFCIPDQLGMPPPGVVVSCRTVITVPPPFRAGVLVFPPPLGSETAV